MYILVTYKGFLEVSHLSNILLISWQRWRRGVAGSRGSRGMFECCRSVSTGNILGSVVSTGKCLVFVEIHNTSFVSISYLQVATLPCKFYLPNFSYKAKTLLLHLAFGVRLV
jgi:hypothetical protein